MSKKKDIINFCNKLGLDIIGISRCEYMHDLLLFFIKRKNLGFEIDFEEKIIEKRINPNLLMKNGKSIISIAFPYNFGEKYKRKVYFSSYTLGRDYHTVVSKYLKQICSFINELGGETRYFVDDTSLPERYLAYKSGIGFIGKNNTVITKKYGSNIFLGEIITSLFLEEDMPIENECGECDICIKACPTKSINKNYNIPNVCISYITQKKNLEDKWFNKLGGRIFGCDTCQDVCPFNNQACLSHIEDFRPYEFMKDINLENIMNMNDDTFEEKYSLVSASWMGKEVLQRNALVNAFDLDIIKDIKLKKFKSSYLEDYYNRLTSYYDKPR